MSSVNEHGQPIGDPLTIDLPRPAPVPGVRQGRFARLEPLELRHAADLHTAFQADGAGFTYLPEGPYSDLSQTESLVARGAASHDPQWYAICDRQGRALGHGTYLRVNPAHGTIEVGWLHFGPAMQRTPLATEAMYLMMVYAFDDLGYRRYEWKCDALNAPSRAAAARLGFTFEGVFRQATTYRGRNRDTAWFSTLDSEWPARKAEFQRWLNPDNFDEIGGQRSALMHPTRGQTGF